MLAEDVRLGVLDLKDQGLVEETREIGSDRFWPNIGLFVEFDRHFLAFNNEQDAVAIANWLINERLDGAEDMQVAARFPDWSPRRLNSAIHYLDEGKIVDTLKAMNFCLIRVTDRTRRFVRDRG